MTPVLPTLAFLGNIGPVQWIVIGVVGLLIFGKRLPEVGKSLGRGIVEFKKGLQGINDEIEAGSKDGNEDSKRLEDPKVHSPHGSHAAHSTSTTDATAEPTKTSTQA